MTPKQLTQKILKKDRLSLARFITLLENRDTKAIEALGDLYPKTGKAIRIGITGPQGVGKSSLLNQLIKEVTKQKKKVGVLAIDPSSALHGGAFLGDRIRMQSHTLNKNVFIRSMATRHNHKGLSSALHDAMTALDAFGCDVIFIETIGIGQDEIAISQLTDLSMLVLSPDFGDKFQALKSGLTETCDLLVVNKIDLPKSKQALATLKEMTYLPVLGVSSKKGTQISVLYKKIIQQYDALKKSKVLDFRRTNQQKAAIREKLEETLLSNFNQFWKDKKIQLEIDRLLQKKKNPNQITKKLSTKL